MQPVKWIQVFNIQRVAAASEWSLPWETECFYSNATSERSSPSFPRPEKTRCVSARNKAKLMCTMSLWPETQFQGAPQKKNKRERKSLELQRAHLCVWNTKALICWKMYKASIKQFFNLQVTENAFLVMWKKERTAGSTEQLQKPLVAIIQSKIWAGRPSWAVLRDSQECSSSKEELWVLFPKGKEPGAVCGAAAKSKT